MVKAACTQKAKKNVYQKGDIWVEKPGYSYLQSGQTTLKALDLTIKEGEKREKMESLEQGLDTRLRQ